MNGILLRRFFLWGLICILFIAGSLLAQWSNDPTKNTPVSRDNSQEWNPRSVSDGSDGAIVVWKYYSPSFDFNIVAQRVGAGGVVLWSSPADICSAVGRQQDHRIISDGAGGAIIAWIDQRGSSGVEYDIYAQRVDSNGNVKWQADGIPVCNAANIQGEFEMVSDDAGGAIIAWRDSRNYSTNGMDIYAQRIDASGNAKWKVNGKPICTSAGDQSFPTICTDGAGGAIIAWHDNRGTTYGVDPYAQKVSKGGAIQWPVNGVGYVVQKDQQGIQIASDGSGGAFIVYYDDYAGPGDNDIRAFRLDTSGNIAWSPGNVWICGSNGSQVSPQIVSDGAGYAIITWVDYRNGTDNPDIYAQRLSSTGQTSWTSWGKLICNATGKQHSASIVSDTFGGAIIAWADYRGTDADIYAQRIEASGALKWQNNGTIISSANKPQQKPSVSLAGPCGAIVFWEDQRWVGDPYDDTEWDIYAQRIMCDGTLPTSTASGPAAPSNCSATLVAENTIDITWQDNSSDEDNFHVEKKGPDGIWTVAGVVESNVTNFHDPGLEPNATYCYRVRASNSAGYSAYSNESCANTSSGSNNTPSGSNVQVTLNSDVNITFETVATSGSTTLDIQTEGPAPTPGFEIIPLGAPQYYEINTTASYSNSIQLELKYNDDGLEPDAENGLKIFEYIEDQSQWLGITTSVDVDNNIIIGTTDHLSVFAIMVSGGGPGHGSTVVTNTDDTGEGSLRNALLSANSTEGPDEIIFNMPEGIPGYNADLGVWVIEPASELPVIADDGLVIWGYSQREFIGRNTNPYGPMIQIKGDNAGSLANGFTIQANDVQIVGLTISGFGGLGVKVQRAMGGRISGCYIGTDAQGALADGNYTGIFIDYETHGFAIVPEDTMRNVISGNQREGISISDTSHHNIIFHNIIGLDRTGMQALGNQNGSGIMISTGSDSNEVFDNWIGANAIGITISQSNGNFITNNWIGADDNWAVDLGNKGDGIYIVDGAQDNQIIENVIGFNDSYGIHLLGTQAIHNRLSMNSISRNGFAGISNDLSAANGIMPPVITTVTETSVSGTALPNAHVEIFSDPEDEGAFFEGGTETDASGNFSWEGALMGGFGRVTATVIDAQGNTSAFSPVSMTPVSADDEFQLPTSFSLEQNYPNPFNPITTIHFNLPPTAGQSIHVHLSVYNMAGELVRTLVNDLMPAGSYTVQWDAQAESGQKVSSGLYVYRIEAGDFQASHKMLLLQ